jgi:hypothetical protein
MDGGKVLVVILADGTYRSIAQHSAAQLYESSEPIFGEYASMDSTADRQLMLVGDAHGFLRVLKISSLTLQTPDRIEIHKKWRAHEHAIRAVKYCETMEVFAVGSADGELVLWTTSATPFAAFGQTGPWPIHTVSVCSDENAAPSAAKKMDDEQPKEPSDVWRHSCRRAYREANKLDEADKDDAFVPSMSVAEAWERGRAREKIKYGFWTNITKPDEEAARKRMQATGDPEPNPASVELHTALATQVRTYFHYLQRQEPE